MQYRPTILILTSDSGFGHRSAANSVVKALEFLYPRVVNSVVVNPILEYSTNSFLRSTELNYDRNVVKHPDFYRFTYEISDSRGASRVVETTLTLSLYSQISQIIQSVHPDVILSTNQLYGAPSGFVLKTQRLKTPFFTAVTDLANVHALWFNDSPDHFFVASDQVKEKALVSGIPTSKVTITGIPVDPSLAVQVEKATLRQSKGLDPALPTLLIVGSKRVAGILDHLEALQGIRQSFQVVVIAGGDNELFEAINRRIWRFPIHTENFVQDMSEWELCADVLITKAGGLILSEGLAAGLPIILIDALPGQEEGNVDFILSHQAGVLTSTPDELAHLVDEWLSTGQSTLKICADHSKHIGHPDSALKIAEKLWQAAEMHTSQPQSHTRVLKKSSNHQDGPTEQGEVSI
jgi:UDP-N-acetylglucosamine:LPS N-acetylglucosamine transferase